MANPWTLSPGANPRLWFPALRTVQTHRYERFLPTACPGSRILGDVGLCVSTKKGSRSCQQWVKKTFLSKNDTGPFGVSSEVFGARSEAPLSRFDLHRVDVSLTHSVHVTQCMPFKRRSMGSNGVVRKGEKHIPFSSPLIPSRD